MDTRRQKLIPLACRFIPYDQWFLTHVDPTWKIKHLKQLILARCFDLPFDLRRLSGAGGGGARDTDGARAPSPITFAPDAGHRPISPIKFANPQELRKKRSGVPSARDDASSAGHQTPSEEGAGTEEGAAEQEQGREAGYEEDDEWDGEEEEEFDEEEEEEEDTLDDLPAPVFVSAKNSLAGPGVAGASGRIGSFAASPPTSTTGFRSHPQPQSDFQSVPPDPNPSGKRKRRFNPLSKIGARDRRRAKTDAHDDAQAHPHAPEEAGIQTAWFTLIRFVTGQVLEDDFPLAWYDLTPHELVELHGSAPLAGFAVCSALKSLLLQGSGAAGVPNHIALAGGLRAHGHGHGHGHGHSHSGPLVKTGVISSADAASALASALLIPSSALAIGALHHPPAPPITPVNPLSIQQTLLRLQNVHLASHAPRLAPLPRAEPHAYVQPYWEGWVRALRTVWRPDAAAPRMADAAGPGGRGRFEYPEYGDGMGGGGGVGLVAWEAAFGGVEGALGAGGERVRVQVGGGRRGEGGWDGYAHRGPAQERHGRERDKTILEWRERWVVIKEGYVYLFKDRDDTVPAHRVALGALVNLRGPEHLSQSIHNKSGRRTYSSGRPSARPTRSTEHRRRSASQPRVSTSAARDPAAPAPAAARKDAPHHSTPRAHDAAHAHGHRAPGTGSTPPTTSHDRRSEGSGRHHRAAPARPPTEAEVQAAKAREAQRELERVKERERRRIRERQEKEIESLRKWDDITLSFPFGKTKDKDKGKGKEKEKGKEKDGGKRGGDSKLKDDDAKRGEAEKEKERAREKDREREKAREREREKEREKERERERRRHEKDKGRDDRTYIPTTRDEAEAVGMKIICAKFLSTAAWERQERERQRLKAALDNPVPQTQAPPRHYTSTGPSLAGTPTAPVIVEGSIYESAGRDRHAEDAHYGSAHGHTPSLAPRKASLPGLGGGGSKLGATSMASLATTGTASSLGRTETLVASSSKFGIGGLFGKDADDAARREKDEKKREEKEKKAREKEQKQLEKEKKKAKRKEEEDDDEFGMGSGLSWKMKKSSKQASSSGAAGTPSSYDARQSAPAKDVQSILTADTSTLNDIEEQARTATSATTVRPKLKISPSAAPRDNAAGNKTDSDSGSSLSISSPVFAHSPDSEASYDEDDIRHGYGKARQGYRYGGYNPAHAKPPQKGIPGASVIEDGNKSESSMGHLTATKPGKDSESSRVHQGNEKPREQTKSHQHHQQAKGKQKAKMDDRGEWLVLDMGSEQAFNSILRIFHRHFSTPLESDFLHPSITATMSLQSSVNPNEVRSMPNSPVLRTFWSASTLAHGSGNGPTMNEDNSSRNDRGGGSDAEDDLDDIYVPEAGPSQQPPSKPAHPQSLTALSKPSHPNPTMTAPALPYPEWRTEVVHRARRYGMREAGRPLELAMYGWGRDFVESETSAVYAKMRKKEEANRQRLRQSISLFNESAKSLPALPSSEDSISDQDTGGDEAEDEAEAEDGFDGEAGTEKGWDRGDSKRRMSTVSHVSTIKANPYGSKAKTTTEIADEDDPEDTVPDDSDVGTEKGTDGTYSDAMGEFRDDEFEGGYAYGLDDEEEALAEGLGSIMNDSEEESEVEWFAWTTDLPRQVLVRQQNAELDRIKEEKLREERDLSEFESQPLSPMEFSNPFPGDNSSFISQNIALPTVLPPIPPPKTPEEERRQYAEKRRKLEPSAVSTSALPPMPLLPVSPRLSPGNHPPASSSLQSNQHMRMQSTSFTQGGYHAQRLSNPSAPLSSPSSSESLGFGRQSRAVSSAAPLNVGVANSLRKQSNPISPLWGMFSPVDDEFGPPSSSTTPPSATGGYTYGSQAHRRAHSRSISGSSPGDNEGDLSTSALRPGRLMLHHSTSMPFASSSNAQTMSTASSPHSPTRISAGKTLTQPISMPILTPAQISQIEMELEEKMAHNPQMRRLDAAPSSLAPSPSTSPPSSSHSHFSPRDSSLSSVPRRSSSAGLEPPGSPPPSSSGLGSSVGRSASVLVRPLPPQPDERSQERGLLRKRRSDLGKSASESDTKEREQNPSPSTRQRPTLSIVGVAGNNIISNIQLGDAQSPTQRRHPRGPRSAHPEIQDINQDGTYNIGSSGAPTSKYQTAKALLRRVRSGSSLGMDSRIDEVSPHAESAQPAWPPSSPPPSTVITNTASIGDSVGSTSKNPDASTTPSRKKIGTMDRIVRGLDSAMEFVDGR